MGVIPIGSYLFHNIKRSVHNILVSKWGTSSDIIAV